MEWFTCLKEYLGLLLKYCNMKRYALVTFTIHEPTFRENKSTQINTLNPYKCWVYKRKEKANTKKV